MAPTHVLLADDHTVVRAGLRNALDGFPDLKVTGEVGNGRELMAALAALGALLFVVGLGLPIPLIGPWLGG